MADQKIISEQDLPFQKIRSKPRTSECNTDDSFARRATKTIAGVALTGDISGAVVGAVTGRVIDTIWRKK